MGFMRQKKQEPVAPKPIPIPTAEPAVAQASVDEAEADKITKKKQQIRAGKSALTVGLKPSTGAVNTGETGTSSAVGGV